MPLPVPYCPRCLQQLQPASPVCTGCLLTLAELDRALGPDEVLLDRIHDGAACIDARARSAIAAAFSAWEARFPGFTAAFYAGSLPPQMNARTFGTWLLNRAALPFAGPTIPNDCGLLFILDPHGGEFAVVCGYALEPWLPPPILDTMLASVRPHLERARWKSAVTSVLAQLSKHLAKAASVPGRYLPADSSDSPPPHLPRLRRLSPRPAPPAPQPPTSHGL